MKTGAIICEYNPLHNGHVYHIRETRKAGITHLIAVLSDDFVQRGDAALLSKFDRARLALQAGADLVLELPAPFSCASAEFYAGHAVRFLHDLHVVDFLSFGCSGNPEYLKILASAELVTEDSPRIKGLLRKGLSYPAAMYRAFSDILPPEVAALLADPNNLLALEYLRAMQKFHVRFQPLYVQRTSVSHDSMETSGSFASASLIRNRFFSQEEYTDFLPDFTAKMLSERRNQGYTADFSRLESVILYQIRMMSEQELSALPDMTPHLVRRFLNAKSACSLEEFLNAVKSKSFTMARIKRILLYALLDIRKEDFQFHIPYARVLAFNQKGTELLKLIRTESALPAGTSLARLRKLSPETERFVQIQTCTANLYGLALKSVVSAESEFRMKIYLTK